MPVTMPAQPRRSARRLRSRSTGLGLAVALLATQLTLGGASAGSTGYEGSIVYSNVPRNGPGADQDSDLWLTSAHSNSDRQLTSTPQGEGTPTWAPDGTRIAFNRHIEDPNGVSLGMWLYAIDPNSGTETLLTNAGSFTWPDFSPDGNVLAFGGRSFSGDSDPTSNNIFTMPSNGGEIRQLTFGPFHDTQPRWSPGGELIAFSSNRSGPGSQIWLMNADGTGQHAIETALSYASSPAWSPDGQWLAVFGVLTAPSSAELFKVRPDGTDLTQLTSEPEIGKGDPTWSPDGSLILFDANAGRGSRGARSNELMVVPADGGIAELFGPGVRHLSGQLAPDWTP
jgi:Tol biopolymer transport system component